MLKLALMSSENRAASVLARNYPGGMAAAVAAMNAKARKLGMTHTTFRDPTGLNSENVSTARDLVIGRQVLQDSIQVNVILNLAQTCEQWVDG